MRTLLICTCFLLTNFIYAQTYTVETVPNEKTVTGSYVSNPDHILADTTVSQIDGILSQLEQASTAQVAVVVLNSIGEEDHIDFAQRLFESWGIGQASNDNGLLILFILDQHEIRLHTGYGVEGMLTDAICSRIEKKHMVPFFKEGKYDEGMLNGVQQVATLLNNPEMVSEDSEGGPWEVVQPAFYIVIPIMWSIIMGVVFLFKQLSGGFKGQGKKKKSDVRMTRKQWALFYIAMPLFFFLPTVYLIGITSPYPFLFLFFAWIIILLFTKYNRISKAADLIYKKNEYVQAYNLYQNHQTSFLVSAFLVPVPMAFFYPFYKRRMKFYRDHPRPCLKCGHQARKLDEITDDHYLKAGQVFEENIGSVDYDVWECANCKSSDIIGYISPSTKYENCPQCNVKALHSISRRTIEHATTSSSGTGEEIKECKYCGHQVKSNYTIPRIQRSSSSSSSSGGSSSSWGGGSSGGGGSSSSW